MKKNLLYGAIALMTWLILYCTIDKYKARVIEGLTNEERMIQLAKQQEERKMQAIKSSNIFTFDRSTCVYFTPMGDLLIGWTSEKFNANIRNMINIYFIFIIFLSFFYT